MPFLLAKSIPLSQTTIQAWRGEDGRFFRRSRSNDYIRDFVTRADPARYDSFINLGRSDLEIFTTPDQVPVYNNAGVVSRLLTPAGTREWLDELMPPQSGETEFIWEKRPGRGGRGKFKHRRDEVNVDALPYWEDHVDGEHYRIITVGYKRVQQFKKEGGHLNAERSYQWLPMRDVPECAKDAIHSATRLLGTKRSVVGWDIVVGNRAAFILEGNTCPGVNTFTAGRISEAVRIAEDIL